MQLTDIHATERTRRLYQIICDLQGEKILSAQQESPGRQRKEMEHIQAITGKLPAIRGMDFIHDDYQGVIQRAENWDKQGGIVSICWHTGVVGWGYPESQQENPDFDLLLQPGTDENAMLMSRWKNTANALLELQKMNIPVLWRPFHEFDGGWFWWGKSGGEQFIRLWRRMYEVFTGEYGLHNLIWVLGYADDVKPGWYPGSDCCDILGSDTYRGIMTHASAYRKLRELDQQKPLAFHETGKLPPVDELFAEKAPWSWLMPWHTKWLMEDNVPDVLKAWYDDPRVITLDMVPKF